MKSSYIKAVLSGYYRFKGQHKLVVTEAGRYNADLLAIKKGVMTEIEIKTSRSDLKADFKKQKHRIYSERIGKDVWIPSKFYFAVPPELVKFAVSQVIDKPYGVIEVRGTEPHMVPQTRWRTLKTEAGKKGFISLIHKQYETVENLCFTKVEDKYGNNDFYYKITFNVPIIEPLYDRARVIKKAKIMHKHKVNDTVYTTCIARLSSEMAGLRQKLEVLGEKDSNIKK